MDDTLRDQLASLLRTRSGRSEAEGGLRQTEAAVLVPIFAVGRELHLLLTKRQQGLAHHAGEISFPGGRRDPNDVTLLDTALREAEEEIGLPREAAQPLGTLRPTSTRVTNYVIHPFVAWITPRARWHASPAEVSAVLELPLRALSEGAQQIELTRAERTFQTDAYLLRGHVIWGATARIIDELLSRASPLLDSE
jgi:8-oxo-dGTP pyrophosphatase MutT (NUDIX family)